MFIDVRGESGSERGSDRGKLLFKWDPEKRIVSLVQKNTLYEICLFDGGYRIISEKPKK